MIKNKSGNYRTDTKDLIQDKKSQRYAQNRDKICEKQYNYYDKNVDFVEKKRISNTQKKSSSKNRIIKLNYFPN